MTAKQLPAIHLRAIEPEDLDVLYAIENDNQLWNVGETNVPYSRYVLYDYLSNTKNDIYTDRQVRMMIENDQHQSVGIVDIINFDPKHQRAEIGIVIMNPFRHQGLAQATLEQIKEYALYTWHLHQLYAYISSNNTTSINLFKKCGFTSSILLKEWLFDGKAYHNAVLMQLFL